jgi:RNA polymerase sigma-70 factor, ECF subfamily
MEGTERIFERMVREHQNRVFALGLALTGNRQDAEEVAQDTFLRAYRALVTYAPTRIRDLKQKAWLHQIALNGSEPDHASGPEDDVVLRAEMDAMAYRVACLPPRYRDAVVLRHVQELSYAEAAEVLGQPVGTVKSNVHRGLQMLKGENHDAAGQ